MALSSLGALAAAGFLLASAQAAGKGKTDVPPLGVQASPAYRDAVVGMVKRSLLKKDGSDDKCSNRDAIMHFLAKVGQVKLDDAAYEAKVEEVVSGMDVVFLPNSVRDKGLLEGIEQGAMGYAISAKRKAAAEKRCKCRIGSPERASAMVLFNNTGDESGLETSPQAGKINDLARHESIHILLPAFPGEELDSTTYHHGLTQYLGWGKAAPGSYKRFNPSRSECARPPGP